MLMATHLIQSIRAEDRLGVMAAGEEADEEKERVLMILASKASRAMHSSTSESECRLISGTSTSTNTVKRLAVTMNVHVCM